jgi:hypothetical protein
MNVSHYGDRLASPYVVRKARDDCHSAESPPG